MAYCYGCHTTDENDFSKGAAKKKKAHCKKCRKKIMDKYIKSNPDVVKKRLANWRKNNPDYFKERYKNNKKSYREYNRLWEYTKYHTDELYNISHKLRRTLSGRIRSALCNDKKISTLSFLGCNIKEFKKYFESLFSEHMTWQDFLDGRIHIDHIIPVSAFDLTNKKEQLKCFHYTNLQPLWAEDNRLKGNTIVEMNKLNNNKQKD